MKIIRYIISFAVYICTPHSTFAGVDASELIVNDTPTNFERLSALLAFLCIALIAIMVVRMYRSGSWSLPGSNNKRSHKKVAVSPDSALIRVNHHLVIEFTNIATQKFLGKTDDDLFGQSLKDVSKEFGLSEKDTKAILKMVKTQFRVSEYGLTYKDVTCDRNGRRSTFLISTMPILEHRRVVSVALLGKDLAVQQKMMDKLIGQAERDHLTGLVNRMGFDKFIENFPDAVRPGSKHVICYMDLDNFKPVNDSAGHAAGDELLKQLAEIFRKHTRASDFLARIGGDEFVIVFPDCPMERAKLRCEDMINSVSSLRFSWGDKSFVVGVSMGAVEFQSGVTVSGLHDLCKIADDACYMAKKKGRNQLYIHDPGHATKAASNNMGTDNWQDIIRDALDNNKFELFVQPIIPLGKTDRDAKKRYEVYVRLPYNGRVLRPGSFFPAAERFGLSRSIDRWVVRRTMERLAKLNTRQKMGTAREFTINLSAASLLDEGFADFVTEQLNKFGLNASSLCFEVSEADVISNFTQARKLLTKLATIGCSNSLDDFGSGLSALNYIRDLPIHYLKIDGVFVRNIETNQIDAAMIYSLSHMSKAMNLKTIAEFVEDEHTAKLLNRLGVNYAQGYYCGRPLPLERLENTRVAA